MRTRLKISFTLLTILLFFVTADSLSVVKRAIASGEWSTPTIWNPSGIPTSSDSVIIDKNGSDAIRVEISSSSAVCAALVIDPEFYGDSLLINNGKVLSVARGIESNGTFGFTGGGGTINVGGNWTNNGVFIPGIAGLSTLRFFGAGNQDVIGSSSTFDNFVVNKSSGIVTLYVDCPVQSNWTDSSGTIDLGAYRMDRTSASGGTFFLASGAYLKIGASNSFPANYQTNTLHSLSTVEYNGTTQTIYNKNYGNVVFSGSGTKTASESITINGSITINSGVTFSGGSNRTHRIFGNWTNDGTYSIASGNIVEFNGTGTQTISGATQTQFKNLKINKTSGSVQLANNISINNAKLLVISGTLDISTFTANRTSSGAPLTDSFSVYGSSTFRFSGADNFPKNFPNYFFDSTSTVELYGNLDQRIPGYSYGTMNLSGSGNKTAVGNMTIKKNFTVSSSVTFSDSLSSNVDSLKGNVTVSGTFLGIGTVVFSGSTSLSGAGVLKFGSVVITGSLFDAGKTLQVRGNWTNNGTFTSSGTTQFDSTLAQTIGESNFNNVVINKSTSTVTLNGNITIANDFILTNGIFSTGSNFSVAITRDVSITSGTFQANASSISVGRNWSRSGIFSSGTSTVTFNGSSSQFLEGTSFYNLTFSGNGLKTGATSGLKVIGLMTISGNGGFNDGGKSDTVSGNIDNSSSYYGTGTIVFSGSTSLIGSGVFKFGNVLISPSSSLNTNSKTISLRGDWTNQGTFVSSDTVYIDSTLTQTINAAKFGTLVINKSSGTVSFGGIDSVTNTFSLISGTLNTNNQAFVVSQSFSNASSGTINAGNSSIYVGGNWSNSGTFNVGNSTVVFTKSGAQTFQGTTFFHVTLSGSGDKTSTGNCTIGGNLTINTGASFVENSNSITTTLNGNLIANGAYVGVGTTKFSGASTISGSGTLKFGSLIIDGTLNDGGKTLQVRGNWSKSGTFTTTGTTQFDSTLSQSISASNFNNVIFNKASGTATLGGDISVANDITISSGIFTTHTSNYAITASRDFSLFSGTFIANGSTITVGRHWKNFGTFTTNTSTVVFNGSSAESLYSSIFYNVSFTGSGIKYFVGESYSVGNNFAIQTNASVSAIGNGTITVTGNWSNAGTFTPNSSSLVFNKVGTATFTGNTDVHNVTIANGTIISMGVNDTLRFSAMGIFFEQGYLSGKIKYSQTLSNESTDYAFGNIGVVLNYAGTSPGTTTIVRTTGTTPSGLDQAVKRFFEITPETNSGLNVSLKLTYKDDAAELNGQTESSLKLWKRPSGFVSWQRQITSVVNTANDTVSLSGVSSLSTWAISSTDVRVFAVASGNWNDSTSWSPAGIPTSTDSIFIPSGRTCTIPNGYPTSTSSINIAGILVASNADTLKVFGQWNNSGTFTSGTGTVEFAGTNQNVSATTFHNVVFSNSGTKTALGNLVFNGSLTNNSGITLNASTYSHTVRGDWINNNGTLISNGQFTFNGTNQIISGGTYYNISFQGNGTKTINSTMAINSNVSIGLNSIVNAGNNVVSVSGNWQNNGTFSNLSGTVTFNGSSQSISASAFGNVTFAGNGTKTATGVLVIKGNVVITNGVTFKSNAFIDSVSGNWTNNGTFSDTGSTIVFNGTFDQTIGQSNFFNVSFVETGIKTASGVLNINGNCFIGNGSHFTAGNFTHTVKGNWTNNGTLTPNNGTFLFSKSGTIEFAGNTVFNNLSVNNATVLAVDTLSVITLLGTLTETGSGYLTGKIQKTEDISLQGVPFTFGGIGATVIANSAPTPSGTTVVSIRKLVPNGFSSSQIVLRYYMITSTNVVSSISFGMKYKESQELNNQTESTLKLWRSTNNGSSWSREATSIIFPASDSLSLSNVALSNMQTMFAISSSSLKIFTQANGNWNINESWNPAGVPQAGDSVYIPLGSSATISGSDSLFCGGIYVAGNLTFLDNGKLNVFGTLNSTGTIVPNSGTVLFSGTPSFVAGNVSLNNVTIVAGKTLRMNSGAVLGIFGTLTNNGTFDATTNKPNTIDYNSTLPQNISTATYSKLIVSGGSSKIIVGSLTLDSIEIGTGTTLNDNGNTIVLRGNFRNKGILNATGTLIADGISMLDASGSYQFNIGNLTISSSQNLSMRTYVVTISGKIINYGTLMSSGTVTLNGTSKTISGTSAPQFKKLFVTGTIVDSSGLVITDSLNVSGSLYVIGATSFNSSSVVSGSPIVTNVNISSGVNVTLAANATLEIRGGITNLGTLTTTANTTNTVWFSSTSSVIPAGTYNHLRITGSTKSNSGNITIKGNFSVDSNAQFNSNSGAVIFDGTTQLSSTPNGTFKFYDVTINNGKTVNGGTLSISVQGNWSNSGSFVTTNGSTITFDGTTTQTISRSTFQNVVIAGSGTKSLSGNLIVNGNFTMNAGTTFNSGSTSDTIKGNLIFSGGTFNANTSSFILNGTTAQSITGIFSFNNLYIINSQGITLSNNGTVNGILSLISGKIETNGNVLILGSSGTLYESGSFVVNGVIQTTRSINVSESFGNIGLKITANDQPGNNTTVTRYTGTELSGNGRFSGNKTIKRYFDIVSQSTSLWNGTIEFKYSENELTPQHQENTLRLWNSTDNGATWNLLGGVQDPSANAITVVVGEIPLRRISASSVQLQPKRINVRMWRDTDGIDTTTNDWVPANWHLLVRQGTANGLVVAGNYSDTLIWTDSLLENTSYFAISTDSSGWIRKAYRDNGVLKKNTINTVQVALSTQNTRTVEFAAFHPSKVTIRMMKDSDGNISTTNDRTYIPWELKLFKGFVVFNPRRDGKNILQLTDSLLEDYTYVGEAEDSTGWNFLGYIVTTGDSSDTITSSQRPLRATFNAFNGQQITLDFLVYVSNTIVVRKIQDTDGNINSISDRTTKPWHLRLFKGAVDADSLVGEVTNSDQLIVSDLSNGTYIATESDSLSWKQIGYTFEGADFSDTTRQKTFSISNGDTIQIDFINTHFNSIYIKHLIDRDNNFSNDTMMEAYPWSLSLRKDSPTGQLLGNVVSDTELVVPNLMNGTYFALATDSVGWRRFGYYKDGIKVNGADTIIQIVLLSGGQVSRVAFVSSNADSGMFRTLKQVSSTINAKAGKMKFKKNKPLPTHTDANIRDTAFALQFPKKPVKRPMIIGVEQTIKDSAKKYGWIIFNKGNNIGKYLPQTTNERMFDVKSGKAFTKGLKNPKQDKYNNRLVGELAVLKLNIAASNNSVTPQNFGNLIFNEGGANIHLLNGRTINEIGGTPMLGGGLIPGFVDSTLTYYRGFGSHGQFTYPEFYIEVAEAIEKINEAFYDVPDPSDTITIIPLKLKGAKRLSEVDFLFANPTKTTTRTDFYTTSVVPSELSLFQNYPNPFNASTRIQFTLPQNAYVTLKVYNILGQEVLTLFHNEYFDEGEWDTDVFAEHLSSGIYFYRLTVEPVDDDGNKENTLVQTRKLTLIK
ncbi:MAG: hypothetical protein FJ218_05170 [Ignavibacteria bacterium]|nr:hypothetical protein [Ignavibacteria bacterium]